MDVSSAAKELVSPELIGPRIDDDLLVPARAHQQEADAVAPGHVEGVLVRHHALDRAEGAVDARGRLRRHDITLEQFGDQLECMPGMPGSGSADRSPGQETDQGARAGGSEPSEP